MVQDLPPKNETLEATIDWSVLDRLRSLRKPDGPDPGKRLITVFISSSPALLESMQTDNPLKRLRGPGQCRPFLEIGQLEYGGYRTR